VIGRDGFLLGGEASYNVTEGRVTKYSGAFGFSAPEYAITLHSLSNFSTFAASYYHRVSPDVEAGAKAVYDTSAPSPAVALEVGTKAYVHYSTLACSCYDSRYTMIIVTSTRLLLSRLKLTILVSLLLVGALRAFDSTFSPIAFYVKVTPRRSVLASRLPSVLPLTHSASTIRAPGVLRIRSVRNLSLRHERSCFLLAEDGCEVDKLSIPYSALNETYLICLLLNA
jgi:hypothetical protein